MARNSFFSKLSKLFAPRSESFETSGLPQQHVSEPDAPVLSQQHVSEPEAPGEPAITVEVEIEPCSVVPTNYDLSRLPENFDPALYLKMNPDLGTAIDPIAHYLDYGFQESWRIVTLPKITKSGSRSFDPGRETVMVVSHEASRSGAPILALNLVKRLSTSYNVVALLLGNGSLLDDFEDAAVATMASPRLKNNVPYTKFAIDKLCSDFNFKFALVNSMECRVVLEPLARHFVPAIPLIHEFASAYPNSAALFSDATLWSSDVVFSANITWESAKDSCPALKPLTAHIIPQGHCVLPVTVIDQDEEQLESHYLRSKIRPASDTERKFVVLGAGYVNFRKGVDIFIQCAIKTMLSPGGEKFRFVWVGKGFNPDVEDGYSVYLADQIKRSGLADRFVMLDETSAIATAYEEADLLFISSRLDPLPNVAIDAFDSRLPVLCFDKATGISDFLAFSGLRDSCIADYLDVNSAVQKIFALAASANLYEEAINKSNAASKIYFDMDRYVAELESIGVKAATRAEQERRDVELISGSGLLLNTEQDVRQYVRSWASGINPQSPRSDFKPDVYLEWHGVEIPGSDPFADYIRKGFPQGVWNNG
ncbi:MULTISPECIES: glycosyltransferase [Pseudomonas]|uniref:glycosyltransferase n=1 Tax=Pseudomonas TaxID=286 RepID=UPI001FAFED54|nr:MULTISPECIES: glycosyltransferase [Pseudomonas]MDH1256827.1 glycosyltransferase [Pseudomonas atacamensis]MEB2856624.1 glycosyltransferase [Pseudomonas atacamensis]